MPGDVGQWRGPPITAGPRRRSRSSRACRASSRRPLRSTGSDWFGIFVRIVLPLSKAVLATMTGHDLCHHLPNPAVTMILAIIPILFIYPFVQRHFVSGVMLGSVKG